MRYFDIQPAAMSRQVLRSWKVIAILVLFSVNMSAFTFLWLPYHAHGATYTWDNDSGNGLWSDCTNWSSDTCPTAADTASFDGANDTDSIVDSSFTGTVDAVSIAAGYTGTTTIARSLTIDNTGGWSQAGGTVKIEGFDISLTGNGAWSHTGGSFHGTTTTITVERNFTIGAGIVMTMSTATTTFSGAEAGADDSTLTCTGTFPGILNIAKTDRTADFTLASTCDNAQLANTISTNGTINLSGDVITGQAFSTVTNSGFQTGTVTLGGTFNAASLTTFVMFGNLTVSGSITNFTGTTTFNGTGPGDDSTLTCTGNYPGLVSIAKVDRVADFASSANCDVTLSTVISTHSNVTFNGDAILGRQFVITGDEAGFTPGSLTSAGVLDGSSLQTFSIGASFTLNGTFTGFTGTTTFNGSSTADDSTLTCTGTYPGIVDISKGDRTSDFASSANCDFTLVAHITTNGSVTFNGDVVAGRRITLTPGGVSNQGPSLSVAGSLDATLLNALNIPGNYTVTGTVSSMTGTTTFNGGGTGDDSTFTCSQSYGGVVDIVKTDRTADYTSSASCNYTLANSVATYGSVTLNGTVTTGQNLTLNSAGVSQQGPSLSLGGTLSAASLLALGVAGNLTVTGSISSMTGTTTLIGTGSGDDTTLTCTGTYPGTLTITKSTSGADFGLAAGCAATLGANIAPASTITISGTLDIQGYNLNATGNINFGAASTLKLQGGNTVVKITSLPAGSTVEYNGSGSYPSLKAGTTYSNLKFSGAGSWSTSTPLTITGDFWQTAGTFTPSATTTFSGTVAAVATTTAGSAFSHIDINKTSVTVTLGGNLAMTGNLALTAGGLDASTNKCSGSSCTITLTGNWIAGDNLFTARTGTVTFGSGSQFVTGTTTFYHLTKTVTAPSSWTFGSNQTQTILGTWTAQGTASNLLTLAPSVAATQWKIDPQGSRALQYVTPSYSNNINASTILAGAGSVDGGLNVNWSFIDPSATARTILKGVHLNIRGSQVIFR